MSQREDDSVCLACDLFLWNNRDAGYSSGLEGIWGPIRISVAEFERELIRRDVGLGATTRPSCALFQLLSRAVELSFDHKLSAKVVEGDNIVLSLLQTKRAEVVKTCKIRIADDWPSGRHVLAAEFG